MINKDFFPTPGQIIIKLISPYAYKAETPLGSRTILEPSAGKGDILDYLKEYHRINVKQMYACEIEPELRLILQGKGYKVIEHDFLKYSDNLVFDLVLMNPPFSDGVDHLLKAWDILSSGDIACILNAESVNNPYTEKRKLLKRLIELHGSVENIGQAFKTAERKTNVECVIVRLKKKPAAEGMKFDGTGFEFESAQAETEFQANPLAHPNIIKALVSQYDHAAKLLVESHKLALQYDFYTKDVIERHMKDDVTPQTLNDKIAALKKHFWGYVFKKTKITEVATSKVRENFYKFIEQTQQLAFSEANILSILEMLFDNRGEIMQQCIDSVFEIATTFHAKNVVHPEGWKHNKSWKIAKKIIVPCEGSWQRTRADDFYDDLDKAMCFVAGVKFEPLKYNYRYTDVPRSAVPSIREALERNYYGKDEDVYESHFFLIRRYKKGTVHLTFKDLDLLAKLNQAAAQSKRWVGGGY